MSHIRNYTYTAGLSPNAARLTSSLELDGLLPLDCPLPLLRSLLQLLLLLLLSSSSSKTTALPLIDVRLMHGLVNRRLLTSTRR